MKQLITILIIILITGLPVCMQAQYCPNNGQPFTGYSSPTQRSPGYGYPPLRSPGDGLPNDNTGGGPFVGGGTGGGGPWDDLPNDNEGGGGWVGMPINDGYWVLFALTVGYGIYRNLRKKNQRNNNNSHTHKSSSGDLGVNKNQILCN